MFLVLRSLYREWQNDASFNFGEEALLNAIGIPNTVQVVSIEKTRPCSFILLDWIDDPQTTAREAEEKGE